MKKTILLLLIALFVIIPLSCFVACSEGERESKVVFTGSDNCEHSYGEWIVVTSPTCTQEGLRKRACTLCGAVQSESMPIEHKGEWTVLSAPGCSAGGVKYRKCTLCGADDYQNVEALGHVGTWQITAETTCTKAGSRHMLCERCGDDVAEEIEALGHDYGEWSVAKQATCLKGDKLSVCSRCEDVKHEEIPADYSKHRFENGECTLCGERSATVGLQYELTDDKTLAVVGYVGTDKEVQIPSYYSGLVVTEIRGNAFKNKSEITSVVIPQSVVRIANGCFSGCASLESLTLPFVGTNATNPWANTVYYDYFFDSWQTPLGALFGEEEYEGGISVTQSSLQRKAYVPSSLRTVTVSGGIIPFCAFENCSMLEEIHLLSEVTEIGGAAFRGCTELTALTLPESVSKMGSAVFSDCSGLKSITIPEGVTSIGETTFLRCFNLSSVTIPASVTDIGNAAFWDCSSLKSIYYENDLAAWCSIFGLSNIPYNLQNLYINGVKIEGDLVIPDGVTSIAEYAFHHNFTSVTIPASVKNIGNESFSTKEIIYLGTKAQWEAVAKAPYSWNTYSPHIVHCTDGDIEGKYDPWAG